MSRNDTFDNIQRQAEQDARTMEIEDAFTGELRQVRRSRNHYEPNDGVPVAPHVDIPRPTVRQRVENLLSRGVDPLANYIGQEGIDMDVPDDPDAPLTAAEANYLDITAAKIAEQAPLPDEGLPRPPAEPAQPANQSAATGGAGGSSPPAEGPGGAGPGASPNGTKSA